MRVQLASNDPKFNDPVLGAQITGGSWSTHDELRRDEPRGCRGAHRADEAAAAAMGVPAGELVVRNSTVSHPKSKKSMSFADIVKSGKATKTFTPDELKAIKLKTPGSVHAWSASRCRSSTSPRRPTARPNTASTSCCRAWLYGAS